MLPDPKKVADVLKKTFRSAEERRQEAELDRDVKFRMAKTRLKRYIGKQKEMDRRLKILAKRALSLNDEARFRQIGRQLIRTRKDVQRWEKYSLSLEILEARRDQVKASVELMESIKAMSESMSDFAEPGSVTDLQKELETGLAKASNLEERMEVMMDVMDSTLSADTDVDDSSLSDLETSLAEEISAQESAEFNHEIENGLRSIRAELDKENR